MPLLASAEPIHRVCDFLEGAEQLDVLQLIEVLLAPSDHFRQGAGSAPHHDLDRSAFPVEEGTFNPARRANTWVMIGGRSQIDLPFARGAAQRCTVRGAECEPGLLSCGAHERKSPQGKLGKRCRHQFWTAGARASQSTTRAGMEDSPNWLMAAARWWPPNCTSRPSGIRATGIA